MPQYGPDSRVGSWNSVLDQLKALTQEMRNFTGEYVQQRGRVSSRTPASFSKTFWTCHGDHLQRNCPVFAREEEFFFGRDKQKAIETGMMTFAILGDVAGREVRINMIAVWRVGVRGTIRLPAMGVIQITRETDDSWINKRSRSSDRK